MFIHSWLHDRSAASRCPAHCCGLTRALAVNARTQCGPGSSLCQRADGAAAFAIGCADGGGPVPMLRRLRSSRLAVLIASVVIGSLLLITGHLDGFKLVATTSAGSEVLPNAARARVHTCTQVYIVTLPAPCVRVLTLRHALRAVRTFLHTVGLTEQCGGYYGVCCASRCGFFLDVRMHRYNESAQVTKVGKLPTV